MTDTLRELDEEIARARGWVYRTWNGRGERWMEAETPIAKTDAMRLDCPCDCSDQEHDGCCNPPPFSSSWALAGPLLEEMARAPGALPDMSAHARGTRWRCNFVAMLPRSRSSGVGRLIESVGATPCEAIARAYLAWHRSKP